METLRLRIEKKGRGGKTLTVVEGLTREKQIVERMTSDLKKRLATGGSFHERTIHLQGDVRERLRPLLLEQGFNVKG